MKTGGKRLVYRLYAISALLIITPMMSGPNPNLAKNNCNNDFLPRRTEGEKKTLSISSQKQINKKKENKDSLISLLNVSGSQTPNTPAINNDKNDNRDPPVLPTETPITIECCITGYNPTSDCGITDSIIVSTKLKLPVQFSGFYPRDKLHEPWKAIHIAREIYIDEYIKEVVDIPNKQRDISTFII